MKKVYMFTQEEIDEMNRHSKAILNAVSNGLEGKRNEKDTLEAIKIHAICLDSAIN